VKSIFNQFVPNVSKNGTIRTKGTIRDKKDDKDKKDDRDKIVVAPRCQDEVHLIN
jgi:hypothetical protein